MVKKVQKERKVLKDKPWYASSTIYAAGALVLYAAYKYINNEPIEEKDIYVILGIFGVALGGIRRSIGKLITSLDKSFR